MKKKFFRIAKIISKKSDHKHQIGSCLVKGNKVISTGFNRNKTSIRRSNNEYNFIHSETDCLASVLSFECENATMYIYRELKDGSLANSRCCEGCLQALRKAKVKKIYYTIDNGFCEEYL